VTNPQIDFESFIPQKVCDLWYFYTMTTVDANTYKVLDLFSGCGGLSLGLDMVERGESRVFNTTAAVDHWLPACNTYELNLGLKPICESVDGSSVLNALQQHGPFDVVVGGPPCQGFSTSGKRALDDPRNSLVLEFLRAVEITKPSAFLMENVSGFRSFQGGAIFKETLEMANALGFEVRSAVVQASHYGVPQRRKRFILVGVMGRNAIRFGDELDRDGLFEFPSSDSVHLDEVLNPEKERWTFWDAVSDLPPLNAGEESASYLSKPLNDLQNYFRSASHSKVLSHRAMGHKPGFIKMMGYIPQGKSALDPDINCQIPKEIRPGKGFPNSYSRIRADFPSPTITRNFTTPSSANCIHPFSDRALSFREGARLQTFPDHFRFTGTSEQVRLQIGNAVPPRLGKYLGELLADELHSGGFIPKIS
jgi:DNA (cytosine-5)-methyltransferase 1